MNKQENLQQGPPGITMRAFFALPEVLREQEIEKRNPYGSHDHREAYKRICALAAKYGASEYLNPEDY